MAVLAGDLGQRLHIAQLDRLRLLCEGLCCLEQLFRCFLLAQRMDHLGTA